MKDIIIKRMVVLIGLLFISIIFQLLTADRSMEDYTQNYINKSLSAKKYNTLKSVVKSKTLYHELKKQKKVTLKFAADNQGSENLAYFPARISGLKGYVGVYINMKSVILHEYKLIKITRF